MKSKKYLTVWNVATRCENFYCWDNGINNVIASFKWRFINEFLLFLLIKSIFSVKEKEKLKNERLIKFVSLEEIEKLIDKKWGNDESSRYNKNWKKGRSSL